MSQNRNPILCSRHRRCLAAFVTAAAITCGSGIAHANAVQPWPDVLVNANLAPGWTLSGEVIGRIADDTRTSQLETRLQLGRALSKSVTAWVGWVHVANYNPGALNTQENQAVEQLNWTVGTWGRVKLSSRTRLEQRFITRSDGTNWRVREQVRLAVALGGKKAPSAVVWSESFLALNHSARQTRTFDQQRTFVGVTFPVTPRLDFEVGYLNQRIYRASGNLVNDAIPLVLTARF